MKVPNFAASSLGVITLCCIAFGAEACVAEVPDDGTSAGGQPPIGVSGVSSASQVGATSSTGGAPSTSGAPTTGGTGFGAAAGNHQGGQNGGAGASGHAGMFDGSAGMPGGNGGTYAGDGGTSAGNAGNNGGASGGNGGTSGGNGGTSGGNGGTSGGNGGTSAGNAGNGGASGGNGGTSAGNGGTSAGNGGTSAGNGGRAGSSGSGGGGTGGGSTIDACAMTTAPTGGTVVSSSNKSGKAAGLDWTIWSNGSGGSITYYDVPAFSAAWNNSGDFLARIGLQWNATKTYDQYGTITAHFNYKRTGTAGGYSYIGLYGWSIGPCVEFYIVEDSFNKMPVNPGSTSKQVVTADTIDGSKYTFYMRPTNGTGGSKCSGGTSSWSQFYSIRHDARQCGEISVSEHFKRWAAEGMVLGKMDQAQILVEVGGGTGSADFSVASVTASTP
jgi:hypothetical protein